MNNVELSPEAKVKLYGAAQLSIEDKEPVIVDFSDEDECSQITNKIRGFIKDGTMSFIRIGSELSGVDSQKLYQKWGFTSIVNYAESSFGFKSTMTRNLISVFRAFSDMKDTLRSPYNDYTFYQLVEMVPMSDELLVKVNPKMTVEQLRELKKGGKDDKIDKVKYRNDFSCKKDFVDYIKSIFTEEKFKEIIEKIKRQEEFEFVFSLNKKIKFDISLILCGSDYPICVHCNYGALGIGTPFKIDDFINKSYDLVINMISNDFSFYINLPENPISDKPDYSKAINLIKSKFYNPYKKGSIAFNCFQKSYELILEILDIASGGDEQISKEEAEHLFNKN